MHARAEGVLMLLFILVGSLARARPRVVSYIYACRPMPEVTRTPEGGEQASNSPPQTIVETLAVTAALSDCMRLLPIGHPRGGRSSEYGVKGMVCLVPWCFLLLSIIQVFAYFRLFGTCAHMLHVQFLFVICPLRLAGAP